jgi:hypothetical protein
VQALGGVARPPETHPRSGQLIEAALSEAGGGGVLQRGLPPLAALLRECVHIDADKRPCAREVVDRLLIIGATLGLVGTGVCVGYLCGCCVVFIVGTCVLRMC